MSISGGTRAPYCSEGGVSGQNNAVLRSVPEMSKTITIPKKEYAELKRRKKINSELLSKIVCGLEDIKAGRIKKWVG